ncbi:MAG: hypothetical protein HeimC3_14010 [Candidatus Heimdallarchaeota archaeon LC_3]|nr:MAG: hypothetical protein HeimC3_14010 [Candidatus Heimdallarchaeota archaeon LC_3]
MNNGYGVYISGGVNSTFIDNNIINNSNGIYFSSAYNNTFYGNNFLHNTVQGFSNSATNSATNGTLGNFWLDHLGIDGDSDGILDTSYALGGSGGVVDDFPLSIWNNESFAPEIIYTPSDITYETHSTGHNLTWRALDESSTVFEIYFNGSSQGINPFNSREFFNVSIDGFDLGETNVTIIFRDSDFNEATQTVIVTVVDTVPPNITILTNITFIEGNLDSLLNWTFADFHPYNYTLFVEDQVKISGLWNNSISLNVNVSHHLKDIYNYTLLVQDTSSNYNISVLLVNVIDGTPPVVSQPSNVTYEQGTSGNNITWMATDNYPANYSIYRDGLLVTEGNWTSGVNITIDVDGLSLGIYNYSIIVYDINNLTVSSFVLVTVEPSLGFFVNHPSDISFLEGLDSNSILWNINGNRTGAYTIYQDSLNISSGTWLDNQLVNYSLIGLSPGVYNFAILLNSSTYEIITDAVMVTVNIDNIDPLLNDESDLLFLENSINNSIQWTFFDDNPDYYELWVNDFKVETDVWPSNHSLMFSLDHLTPGEYNYTLFIYDLRGNYANDTVLIFVVDATAPVISSYPSGPNVTLEYGHILNLTWQAYDYSSSNYTVYVDNVGVITNVWINKSLTNFSISDLNLGNHNVTIVFRDFYGLTSTHEVLVIVEDITKPELSSPIDLSFTEGVTGAKIINWSVIDDFNGTYLLYRNGTLNKTGSWNGSDFISIDVSSLSEGAYNFTLIVTDFSGNTKTDIVEVTVLSSSSEPPSSSEPSSSTTTTTTPTTTAIPILSSSDSISISTTSLSSPWSIFFFFVSFVLLFWLKKKKNT